MTAKYHSSRLALKKPLLWAGTALLLLLLWMALHPPIAAAWGRRGDETSLAFISEVYDKVTPSVVYISNVLVVQKEAGQALAEGSGSGVICSAEGYIITNHHVIAEALALEVTLSDGRSFPAQVVAEDSGGDLALLRIEAPDLIPAALADSSQVRVGDVVFPIGNPGGAQFARSMTMGIISGLDRQIVLSDGVLSSLFQTDAAINPGNSGGPLVDCQGRVIGVNSVKIVDAEYEGMGFAIPINTVIEVLAEICPEAFE